MEVVFFPTSLRLEGKNFSAVFKKLFFLKKVSRGDKTGAHCFDQAQPPLW